MTFVEVEVKRAMIDAAHQVVVVADSSKFEHRALAPVVSLDRIDLIVTDNRLDPALRGAYGERLLCVGVDDSFAAPSDPALWARRPRGTAVTAP